MYLENNKSINRLEWFCIWGLFTNQFIQTGLAIILGLLLLRKKIPLYFGKQYCIYFFVVVYSTFSILFLGYSMSKMVQQALVIGVHLVVYTQFIVYDRYRLLQLFKKYIKACIIVSVIGIMQFIIFFITSIDVTSFFIGRGAQEIMPHIIRINSILYEPGTLSTMLCPALIYFFYFGDVYRICKSKYPKYIVLFVSFLTFGMASSLVFAFLVIAKIVEFIGLKHSFKLIVAVSSIVFILIFSATLSGKIEVPKSEVGIEGIWKRIVESVLVFEVLDDEESFETKNASTYSLFSNLYVASNAPNRILGTGLGTHKENYENVYVSNHPSYGLNNADGYSLLNRIFSEFGVVGVLMYLLFLMRRINSNYVISFSLLFMLISLTIRGGHYFLYGTVFFFLFYHYSYKYQHCVKCSNY